MHGGQTTTVGKGVTGEVPKGDQFIFNCGGAKGEKEAPGVAGGGVIAGGDGLPAGGSYWSPKAPSSGLKLTPYGVNLRVLGGSEDNSVGAVGVYLDK